MNRTLPVAVLFASLTSCGLLGKRVSEDDCTRWDEHYRKVLETGVKKRLKPCKDEPAAKGYLKSLDETIATAGDGMAQGCHAVVKIGSYSAEEEKCFLDASDPKDWSKCTPKPTSAMNMYVKAGAGFVKSAEGICKGESSDEEEDTPKKKKKKSKGDDDE